MASPLGTFADLSSYRRLVDAQKARQAQEGGLGQLISNFNEGAMQGNTMVNIPEIIAQQNQLRRDAATRSGIATQLQQEALRRSQNPNIGLQELIQGQLARQSAIPGTGVLSAPAGLEGEVIQQPAALSQMQQTAIDQAGALPSSEQLPQAGTPLTPILGAGGLPTGFISDPAIPAALKNEAQARALELAGARNTGAKLYTNATTGESKYFSPGQEEEGFQAYIKPVAGTTAAGSRPITETAKTNLLVKAGKAKVDASKFTDPTTGQTDWQGLALEIGKQEGASVDAINAIKMARTAKLTDSQTNLQLYGNRMAQANQVLSDLASKGFDATELGTEGLLGSWTPNLLKSGERQQFEQAQRNFINAVLRRESGATITDPEFINAQKQYFPQPGDSEDVLKQKQDTRNLVINEFKRLGTASGGTPATSSPVQTPGINPNAAAPVKPSKYKILSVQ